MNAQEMPIDNLLKKMGGSVYKLAIIASRRAIELSEGASRLVDASQDSKPCYVALKEILEGKISYKAKDQK